MKVANFSKRLYKDKMAKALVDEISCFTEVFNQAKRFAFQTLVREKRWKRKLYKESSHLVVKKKFSLNDYVANSVVREANALFSSRTELNKLYIQQTEEKIKKIKKKLKSERKHFTQLKKIKESCIKGNLRFPKNLKFSHHSSGIVSLEQKKQSLIWFNTYLFEHQHIDKDITFRKAKIGRLEHRLFRLEEKKEKLKTHIPSVVFGTKKLFKQQFTKEEYIQDHASWRKLFLAARNKEFLISGRKDAGSGNFVFHYNTETNELHITTLGGQVATIPDVTFPYGQEIVNQIIDNQKKCKNKKEFGKPISWSVENHGDYYIIKNIVDVESNPYINFSTSDGIIGVDCNVDHFAWADLSKDGNYLDSGKFSFSVHKKAAGQITKIIEAEAIALVNLAVRKNKPIVMENIDTTLSKTGDAYGNKKANRMKSIFAYRKMAQAIISRANKLGVDVIQVTPAYTSISGKMKYMRKFGISIHQSAAYTIGRRGLGYKEKAPKVLNKYIVQKEKHHWSQWSILHKKFSVNTNSFYHIFNVNKPYQEINVHHSSLREEETKQLLKALT
jgi:IS605 OrfB family transposase